MSMKKGGRERGMVANGWIRCAMKKVDWLALWVVLWCGWCWLGLGGGGLVRVVLDLGWWGLHVGCVFSEFMREKKHEGEKEWQWWGLWVAVRWWGETTGGGGWVGRRREEDEQWQRFLEILGRRIMFFFVICFFN